VVQFHSPDRPGDTVRGAPAQTAAHHRYCASRAPISDPHLVRVAASAHTPESAPQGGEKESLEALAEAFLCSATPWICNPALASCSGGCWCATGPSLRRQILNNCGLHTLPVMCHEDLALLSSVLCEVTPPCLLQCDYAVFPGRRATDASNCLA